ncbi:unnamed protein product [Arctogadus glacialis]
MSRNLGAECNLLYRVVHMSTSVYTESPAEGSSFPPHHAVFLPSDFVASLCSYQLFSPSPRTGLNWICNWAGMRCPYKLLRMILALVCMSSEVGRAVWLRFSPPLPAAGPQPSFMAHLSGAAVGVSMGLLILRSYEESLQRQCTWWVIVFSFITFLLFAIFWNIFAYELLGVQIPPPP